MMTWANTNPRHAARRAFTLVEMLVVVALMTMLMVFTVMAIGSMGMERKLATGGAMTADLINNARQLSRAANTMTMVALVKDGVDGGRALTLLTYSGTATANGGWAQADQWRLLPDGVAVDQTTPAASYLFKTPPSAVKLTRAGKNVNFSSAIFLPDGRPLQSGTLPQTVFLRPAVTGTSGANYYKIIVNQATGIPFTRRP